MIVLQTGTIGRFDFQTLLLTFISGFGLMAAATVVVDFLATKIIPKKDYYAHVKYQEVLEPAETPALPRADARTPMLQAVHPDPSYDTLPN